MENFCKIIKKVKTFIIIKKVKTFIIKNKKYFFYNFFLPILLIVIEKFIEECCYESNLWIQKLFDIKPNTTHFAIVITIIAIIVPNITVLISSGKYKITFIEYIYYRQKNSPNTFYNLWTRERIFSLIPFSLLMLVLSTIFDFTLCFLFMSSFIIFVCIWVVYMVYICHNKKKIEELVYLDMKTTIKNIFYYKLTNKITTTLIDVELDKMSFLLYIENFNFSNTNDIKIFAQNLCESFESKFNSYLTSIFDESFYYYYFVRQLSESIAKTITNNGMDTIIEFYDTLIKEIYNMSKIYMQHNEEFLFITLCAICDPLFFKSKKYFILLGSIKKNYTDSEIREHFVKYLIYLDLHEPFYEIVYNKEIDNIYNKQLNEKIYYTPEDKRLLQNMFYFWTKNIYPNTQKYEIEFYFEYSFYSLINYECSENYLESCEIWKKIPEQ